MQHMVVDRETERHRQAFAERLRYALVRRFGERSGSEWAALLRRCDISISQQGLNKWLTGTSLPAQHRWDLLADVLEIPVSFLRDGEDLDTRVAETAYRYELSNRRNNELIAIVEQLTPEKQDLIKTIAKAFLRSG